MPPADTRDAAGAAACVFLARKLGWGEIAKCGQEVPSRKGIRAMMPNYLRVYNGPQEEAAALKIAESQGIANP